MGRGIDRNRNIIQWCLMISDHDFGCLAQSGGLNLNKKSGLQLNITRA